MTTYYCGQFSITSLDRHTCRNEILNTADDSWECQNDGKEQDIAQDMHFKISLDHYTKYWFEISKFQSDCSHKNCSLSNKVLIAENYINTAIL